jgi:hypothetical protein
MTAQGRERPIRQASKMNTQIALRKAGIGPGCYETQMLSENVPDGAVRCSRWVVPGDCVRVFSRCSIRIHAIAAQKPLSNASIGVFARILSGDFTPYVALTASMSARIPIRLITRFML